MSKLTRLISGLLLAITLSAAAQAQAPRVFVSANGVDGGTCVLANPCRTFNFALTQVTTKGEIIALDTGDYEPMTLNKAVTVQAAPGAFVGVSISNGNSTAVRVTAGSGSAVVLRGLTINTADGGAGQNGISSTSGASLFIEDCTIKNASAVGIFVQTGAVVIKRTTVRGSFNAILIGGGATLTKATVEDCQVEDSIKGLLADANSHVTASDTFATGNNFGFAAENVSSTSPVAQLNLENCFAAKNGVGVRSISNAIVRVSNSTVVGNSTGLSRSGVLLTRGNNMVEGNTNQNGTFSDTFAAK